MKNWLFLGCFTTFLCLDLYASECVKPVGEINAYLGYSLGIELTEFQKYAECLDVRLNNVRSRDRRTKVVFYDEVTIHNSNLLPKAIDYPSAVTTLKFTPTGKLAIVRIRWAVPHKIETDRLVKALETNFGRPKNEMIMFRDSLTSKSSWTFIAGESGDTVSLNEKSGALNIWLTLVVESGKYKTEMNASLNLHKELLKKQRDRKLLMEEREENKYEALF